MKKVNDENKSKELRENYSYNNKNKGYRPKDGNNSEGLTPPSGGSSIVNKNDT